MSIETQLDEALKAAMRSKDADRVACIRQVRAKVGEAKVAKGFDGKVDDALHQRIIGSYVKSLQKAGEELGAAGDRGEELRRKYAAEVAYLEQFLPKLLGEAETRELVVRAIAESGVDDLKQSGKVMGAIMKTHRQQVDAGLVRRLVEEALS